MDRSGILKELGIDVLTGEADATGSGRMLCDIPHEIADDLREYLGAIQLELPEGWNKRAKVAVMVTHTLLRELLKFSARRKGFYVVELKDSNKLAYVTEEDAAAYRNMMPEHVRILPPIQGVTRNTHQMSGRTL